MRSLIKYFPTGNFINLIMQQLFQNIFGRDVSFAGDPDFRGKIKSEFPYFGPAHFFSLKHTLQSDPSFNERAARAALFFNDLFYLNGQLKEEPTSFNIPEEKTETIEVAEVTEPANPSTFLEAMPLEQPEAPPEGMHSHNLQPSDEPLFEPLHSTDYFASQGIKLSEDALAADKLGRQLKSFTAWLKTMKKVHPESSPAEVAVEIAVQNLAEKSNIEEEVVTEAMAEACRQQGKHGKAIDIYSKLSLQNPSKSAYFAAKIESLKQ